MALSLPSVARVLLAAVLLPSGTIVYLYLFKMMSFMQSRLGPMEAGPYGSMQLFAEVGKWLQSCSQPAGFTLDLVSTVRCNFNEC